MNAHALYALAVALARVKHDGQTRKGSGEPYLNHLHRVAGRVTGTRAQTVAYLHDLVEDTDMTLGALLSLGFNEDIVRDVDALSRRADETYAQFIQRTVDEGSHDALLVKLADIADNMADRSWAEAPRARYIKADAAVRAELACRGIPAPSHSG